MITTFGHVQEGGELAPEQGGDGLQGPQPESSNTKQTQGDVDNLLDALGF